MYSVIIPTLLKSDKLEILLNIFERSDKVKEIILINNALKSVKDKYNISKLHEVIPAQNLFVNPSWNLGVSLASEENLIIANDDIIIEDSLIDYISTIDLKKIGIIGPSKESLQKSDLKKRLSMCYLMDIGFGTLMFMAKKNYHTIPENIKIWSGDNYLFSQQNNRNYVVSGFFIDTEMHTTSSSKEFDVIKQQDWANFGKVAGRYKYYKKYKYEYHIKKIINIFFK